MTPEVEQVRTLAYKRIEGVVPQGEGPIECLRNFPWKIGSGSFTQAEMGAWGIALDQRSCLGRVALSAAFTEAHFSNVVLSYGEVWQDQCRDMLLSRVLAGDTRHDVLKEILLYEEPHGVLLVDNVQFDTLETTVPFTIAHPQVERFPLWEGITSGWIICHANQAQDPIERLRLIASAEEICPGLVNTAENRVGVLALLGREEECLECHRAVVAKRPTARSLYVLWLMTGDIGLRLQLHMLYTPAIEELIMEEVKQFVG